MTFINLFFRKTLAKTIIIWGQLFKNSVLLRVLCGEKFYTPSAALVPLAEGQLFKNSVLLRVLCGEFNSVVRTKLW